MNQIKGVKDEGFHWISKSQPHYVWRDDFWERETDHKIFCADYENRCWAAEDGEKVYFTKSTKLMSKH